MLCCRTALAMSVTEIPRLGQHVRVDPDAHRVLGGAKNSNIAYARRAEESVNDIDVVVVCEKQRVIAVVRRKERDQQHGTAGRLTESNPKLADVRGQTRQSL